jgi:glyoxylase-like metal-dependent hydrolase (beta-lactamase superfamily II)
LEQYKELHIILRSNRIPEILPGFYQIRLPIPIRSLGFAYAYFAQDGNENLLIDTGWPSKDCFYELERSLGEIDIALSAIKNIVISHLHPDHFGLAEQIRDVAPNSKLIIHKADAGLILESYEEYSAFLEDLHAWLSQHGTPTEELEAMLHASSEMLNFFRPPKPTGVLTGGEKILVGDKWNFEVIPTPGHTIGTICLYDRKSEVLFSGDHILPTITPNISLGPFYNGNPLGDYLDSLDRVNELDVNIILPSHEFVFSNLKKRVAEIKAHHRERLNDALSALKEGSSFGPLSAYEIASKLKWYSGTWQSMGAWERRAALMETLAHLEYLRRERSIIEVTETHENNLSKRFKLPR